VLAARYLAVVEPSPPAHIERALNLPFVCSVASTNVVTLAVTDGWK